MSNEFNETLRDAPNWFLRFLVAVLILLSLGAIRVEARLTSLEERDLSFAKTFDMLSESLNKLVTLVDEGVQDIRKTREVQIRVKADLDAVNTRFDDFLEGFHNGTIRSKITSKAPDS